MTTDDDWPPDIQFAPWNTLVQNDELVLWRVNFEEPYSINYALNEGLISSPKIGNVALASLFKATFLCRPRKSLIHFDFGEVRAFRVLNENSLLELWTQSETTPRPASTTFRARGHKWQRESVMTFMDASSAPRFSYFVATDFECLEVVCENEPSVTVEDVGA